MKTKNINYDKDGVDDVVIEGDWFRLERMNDGTFWVAIYRGKKRVSFLVNSKTKIEVKVQDDEL